MFEEWIAMEEFYYQNFWIGLILIIILMLVFVVSVLNRENRWVKLLNTASFVGAVGIGFFLYTTYQTYQPLINLSERMTPAQRAYKKMPFSTTSYSYYENKVYENGYMKESFSELAFYEEKSHSQEVDYLGKDDRDYHYFQVAGQNVYTSEKYVELNDTFRQPVRVGSSFQLTDSRFMDRGFYEESKVYFEKYIIPDSAYGKKVEKEVRRNADYQSRETIARWIYP